MELKSNWCIFSASLIINRPEKRAPNYRRLVTQKRWLSLAQSLNFKIHSVVIIVTICIQVNFLLINHTWKCENVHNIKHSKPLKFSPNTTWPNKQYKYRRIAFATKPKLQPLDLKQGLHNHNALQWYAHQIDPIILWLMHHKNVKLLHPPIKKNL